MNIGNRYSPWEACGPEEGKGMIMNQMFTDR